MAFAETIILCGAQLQQRMSLIQAFFPDVSEARQHEMLSRLMATACKSVERLPLDQLGSVMKCLEHEPDFGKLSGFSAEIENNRIHEMVMKRFGQSHGEKKPVTPAAVKDLCPPTARIWWQLSASTFEGYYAIPADVVKASKRKVTKKDWTCSRTYGAKHTVVQALSIVINKLWKFHRDVGGKSCLVDCVFFLRFALLSWPALSL